MYLIVCGGVLGAFGCVQGLLSVFECVLGCYGCVWGVLCVIGCFGYFKCVFACLVT